MCSLSSSSRAAPEESIWMQGKQTVSQRNDELSSGEHIYWICAAMYVKQRKIKQRGAAASALHSVQPQSWGRRH